MSISSDASGEEGLCEAGERVAFASKQSAEQHRLLRSHAHPLAPYRIEAANGIAEGKKAARECFQPLEVPPHTCRKTEPHDIPEAFCLPDGVVNGRSGQLPRKAQEPVSVARRLFTISTGKGCDPSFSALERHHQASPAALGSMGKCCHTFPIGGSIVRNRKDRRRITDVHTNAGFLRRLCPIMLSKFGVSMPRPEASTTRSAAILSLLPSEFS